MQDVKTLTLTPNPAPPATDISPDSLDRAQFICPLTMKEMNGAQPFVYISTCGCVFSQAGLKTVSASESPKDKERASPPEGEEDKPTESFSLCPQCAKKYSKDDILPLNPSPEEQLKTQFALDRKRQLEPAKKKSKKRKNDSSPEEAEPPSKKQAATVPGPSLNPAIAGASRAVVKELEKEEEKRKANMSAAVKSLYGDGKQRKETFMTMGTFTRVCSNLFLFLCQLLRLFFSMPKCRWL